MPDSQNAAHVLAPPLSRRAGNNLLAKTAPKILAGPSLTRLGAQTKGHALEGPEAMTPEEGMRALGCSRRTWCRRLEDIRARRA